MSLTLIGTTDRFTPDMIDDVVEVLVYSPLDGSTSTCVGTLASYQVNDDVTAAWMTSDQGSDEPAFRAPSNTRLTINHYEWDGLSLEETDS